MPRVTRVRRSRKTRRATTHRRRTVVVNPKPRRRRRYARRASVYAPNPRRRVVHRRRRSYRKNPAELMELGSLLANPRMSKKGKDYAEAMLRTGMSPTQVAKSLRYSPGTIYRFAEKRKMRKHHYRRTKKRAVSRKKKTPRRTTHRKKSRRGRASRILRFRVPRGRSVGKVRVEFNPRFSWMQLKESATSGVFAIAGFAASSLLTNIIASKFGTGLTLGPLKSPTVIATLVAALLPFIPIQFPRKEMIVAGAFTHAFARLIRDVIPTSAGIQGHLPGTLGEFAGLMSLGQYGSQGYVDPRSLTGQGMPNSPYFGLYQDTSMGTYIPEQTNLNEDPYGMGMYPDAMLGTYPDEEY